jgi:ankyrin repeat protein
MTFFLGASGFRVLDVIQDPYPISNRPDAHKSDPSIVFGLISLKTPSQKFPHLIQVPTIENFLPFHAVCSQGHLAILQLLLAFIPTKSSSELEKLDEEFQQIYTDYLDRRYLSSFDLNALDMNGQSGFHLAVLGNHLAICKFLVEYKVKQLDKQELDAYEQKRTKKMQSLLNSNKIKDDKKQEANEPDAPQYSLFDHFKNVFLDPKSYDPYVVNYVSNPHDDDYLKIGSYLYNTYVASVPDVVSDKEDAENSAVKTSFR